MINPQKKGVQTSIQTFNLRKASDAVAGGDKSVRSGESGDGINTTP